METTEIKKKGKIKHCYPRSEIYHRWIHSDEYVYTPKGGHECSGVGNYLFVLNNYYHGKTNEGIKEGWINYRERVIAIIDRDNKRILISDKYSQHNWLLQDAIPDDYEIFRTNEVITNPDILQNDEELFKTYAKYLIEYIVQYYNQLYLCLDDKTKLIHEYNEIPCQCIGTLKDFVDKHKLKKYDFYKEHFGNYLVKEHYGYNAKTTLILLPNIKDVLTNKMFSKKQKLKIEQHKFYTKYCNGNGVSLKFLIENWDKIPTREEAIKYFENKTKFRNQHNRIQEDNKLTWQELIKQNAIILDNYCINKRNRCIEISNENFHRALDELKSFNNYSVNAWRENKVNSKREISYKKFVSNYRKGQIGKWQTIKLSNSINSFENTQLKLNHDKNCIRTSKNAVVPLDDAIKKFKFIHIYIDNCNKRNLTSYEFNNVNVGIYNLRFIKYTNKKTDNGKLLGRNEWLIQIGCHSLWLDDVIDFIHYYKLEKEFGIDDKKKDVKLKIQMKK